MALNGRRVAICGVGYSTVGRKTGLTYDELARQAAVAALDDAGLTAADVDGVSTWSGMGDASLQYDAMTLGFLVGFSPLDFYYTAFRSPAFVDPAVHAVSAVATGLCDVCVAFRLMRQQPGATDRAADAAGAERPPPPDMFLRATGSGQFELPYGSMAAGAGIGGLQMQAHMARFGTTEEQFAINAVNQRYHASLNDDALLRQPITVEDYLDSRYIAKPLRMLDCDYPCDAGSVVIFTTEERARDCRKEPVFVEACTLSATRDFSMSLLDDFATTSPAHCGEKLWSRTDLTSEDVDTAQLYDGFSVITFQWLEALGLCPMGEAGPFVEAGNTRLGGSLPLNTDGGACNVGRRHGANFCIESVRQLRGESGPRQVPDADVAVWANATGCFSGSMLLTSA